MSTNKSNQKLAAAAQELAVQVDRLKFAEPVAHVYNPLIYAWKAHEEYLHRLDQAVEKALSRFDPQLLMYVAGADPYKEDQLGGLALTIDGLMERDRLVFGIAKHRKIPVCVSLAGGYARRVEDTVTIQSNTAKCLAGME